MKPCFSDLDKQYMMLAIKEAEQAAAIGEVPVGAVIVSSDGAVLAQGHNLREIQKNALHHAEILVIDAACQSKKSWRLSGCTLYVTLEPCLMCSGAIVNARIDRVVYGAKDARAGAMGSLFHVNSYPLNHKPIIESGLCEETCCQLLTDFFKKKRK